MSEDSDTNSVFTGPDVKDVRTLKALAHPLRMQILEYLGDHEKATSTTLAQHLGESTGQTSYHLRQLAKYGFVQEAEGQGNARERWWKSSGYSVHPEDIQSLARQSPLLGVLTDRLMTDRFEKLSEFQRRVPGETPEWVASSAISVSTATMTAGELKAMRDEIWAATKRHVDAADERYRNGDSEQRRRVRINFDAFALPPQDLSSQE